MEVAGQGVDHKVDVLPAEQLGVVGIDVTAEQAGSLLPPLRQGVHHGGNAEPLRIGGQEVAVNVQAAAALSQHCYVESFLSHSVILSFPMDFGIRGRCAEGFMNLSESFPAARAVQLSDQITGAYYRERTTD